MPLSIITGTLSPTASTIAGNTRNGDTTPSS
jgi:hypothetical protein